MEAESGGLLSFAGDGNDVRDRAGVRGGDESFLDGSAGVHGECETAVEAGGGEGD